MKKLMMGAIVVVGCLTPGAQAVITGLTMQLHTTTTPSQTNGIARDVYRVYALFTAPNDLLTGVFGNVNSPFTVNLNGATPFNPASGGNVPVNSVAMANAPEAEFDCHVTIGLAAGYVGEAGAHLFPSPGFPAFISAAGIINHTNMAWTTGGVPPQTIPDALGRVFIMQIAVNAGDSSPSGSVGINYIAGGTVVSQAHNQTFAIPGPSVFAILSIVGLVGRRRRDEK